jgi:hypothetical protein
MLTSSGVTVVLQTTPRLARSGTKVSLSSSPWRLNPNHLLTTPCVVLAKKCSHTAGSLPDLVEKLVKNWEIEASYKMDLNDWRTIDKSCYQFSVNGGEPQPAEHMLKVGTYNALISPNEFYCPAHSSFEASHKTFKRMMPAFAWEVLEVYSGPPKVVFKWRHWGTMKEDYSGTNECVLPFLVTYLLAGVPS